MSLSNDMSPADFAAITGNNDGFGNGNGWWLILLFLFAFNNGGWGNGYGNNGGAEMQRGFDQSALVNQLSGIQSSLSNGFANAEIAACGRAADALQTAYNNQIASMNQNFSNQMALQNCCCENRAGLADLKYTVATENCADRNAIANALRDVIDSNSTNTQKILDTMCQDKIDAKNEKIQSLENQLNIANLQASQTAQTARLLADNAAQTNAVEQYLNPTPIPAYVVQNPNCCSQNTYCGCNL